MSDTIEKIVNALPTLAEVSQHEWNELVETHIKDYLRENNILIHYVRKPSRLTTDTTILLGAEGKFISCVSKPITKPSEVIGTVVAIGRDQVGWSKRMPTDRYNRYLGIYQALTRVDTQCEPCHSMKDAVDKMKARAAKYFKVPAEQ